MTYQRSHKESDVVNQPACVYLRSKAMYVTGDFNPTHADEAGSHACWCNLTQYWVGPDNQPVERSACVSSRDCYRSSR